MRAVIIGGGIAGLSAAYALNNRARQAGLPLRITLIERQDRLGGVIQTEQLDGFVVEGGPDSFVSTKPWAVELCQELGIAERVQGANAQRRVYVLRKGQLIAIPKGLTMMVPTHAGEIVRSPLISPIGKLRLGLELVVPRRRDTGDESVRSFVSRRLGEEAYERLIEPLMSGIYGGDGDRLSLQATMPIWHEWEQRYGSLTRAAWANRAPSNGSGSIFLTLMDGLGELVQALVKAMEGVEVRRNVAVAEILSGPSGFTLTTDDGETFSAQVVILAAPAYAAARMLSLTDPELAQELSAIEYSSSATVSLAFRREDVKHPLDGHGYLIPRHEHRAALACTWTSEKFPHRAPKGSALLRVFFGQGQGPSTWGEDEDKLRMAARDELDATLGLRAEPLFARVFHWPQALPQYTLGHLQRVGAIDRRLVTHPGLLLAGAAYDGVGIPDCIHSGQRAAEAAMNQFGRTGLSLRLE
ncbi:MAG: protoporphyrinogen oxidase [Chloroflexi bacterium]|nr:protoporphyrinogen oxidase [Chloroflexota bacterium]